MPFGVFDSTRRFVTAVVTGGQSETARREERFLRKHEFIGTGKSQAKKQEIKQQQEQQERIEADARSEAERQRLLSARRSRGRASTVLTGGRGISRGSERIGVQRLLGS